MKNVELAAAICNAMAASGVREVVVCGGSRNVPFVAVLSARPDLVVHSFFEERSAAFFAIGRSRATNRPVAVVTTSGTAAAELLPASIEAHYSGTPLLLITADRPRRFRGTGAPQAIEQAGLFGPYAEASVDLEGELSLPPWSHESPYHINVCFDEPLLDGEVSASRSASSIPKRDPIYTSAEDAVATIHDFLEGNQRLLLLLGELDPWDRNAVRDFAQRLGAPVRAEALSGLREDEGLADLAVRSDRLLATAGADAVLRIGGVPTTRIWRELDNPRQPTAVLSISRLPFSGLSRGAHLTCNIAEVLPRVTQPPPSQKTWFLEDRGSGAELDLLLARHPRSEPSIFRKLSETIPPGSLVYLGNSLPIREWDLAASPRDSRFELRASRGANGIDGQLSTFFGYVSEGREHWCIVGDLTAMYDLAAPWILSSIPGTIRIVVINNGGGRIFSRVPATRSLSTPVRETLVENRHSFDFRAWASMWRIDYSQSLDDARSAERIVLELQPDADQTEAFWVEYDGSGRKG
ncbi:MAG TPA: 2-succinyl-5-enolpyruvyl-6-hydroxy-3-cyclohexene-1-carboxylic-acid synthase [Thermoanaerobaculia bacterium]|nr:2-succinyl-5-enolpyruvyl-6-hydroxy-3-cyclohexene-1-carboxylic-acid synthase [Thermoanaerobaculia bacterium]